LTSITLNQSWLTTSVATGRELSHNVRPQTIEVKQTAATYESTPASEMSIEAMFDIIADD